jgi:hypothetical protein
MSDQTLSSYNEFLKNRYAKYAQIGSAESFTKGLPLYQMEDSDVLYNKTPNNAVPKPLNLGNSVEKIVENYVPVNIHKGLMNGIFDKKKIDLSLHVHTDGHGKLLYLFYISKFHFDCQHQLCS